jgi:hypothetical protein
VPDVDDVGSYENGERGGSGHLQVLRTERNFAALKTIGDYSSDQREKKDGNAAEELIEGQQEGGMAETIDEPALRHDLHPRTDAGSAGAKPHQAKVAILKCLEDAANNVSWHSPRKSVPCGDWIAGVRSVRLCMAQMANRYSWFQLSAKTTEIVRVSTTKTDGRSLR